MHQWLGVALILLTLVHLFTHWNWVQAVTTRLFKGTNNRSRGYYLIDFLILFGFVVIAETGLVISTWFDLPLQNYPTWVVIHTYASVVALGLTFLKIGLHGRWIVRTTRSIFLSEPQAVLLPAEVPVSVITPNLERRQFLVMMGVVGLGSVLAVSNLISKTSDVSSESLAVLDELDETELIPSANSPTHAPMITTEDEIASTPVPTSEPQDTLVSNCTVRCSRGCSFPGQCRRYVDQNNNQLCDLGECL